MALVHKKGGPYTKDDQESRRNEVYRLHFEFGYSARKISEIMKINRNTINSDIKYWYENIRDEIKQQRDDLILQQLGRLEAQRTRILDSMADANDKIKHERLLLEIDTKINNILLRISSENKEFENKEPKNNNDLIREIILFLIIKYSKDPCLKKEQMVSEIINICQCKIEQAENIFSEMFSSGLECCKKFKKHYFIYDLVEFAFLRKYFSPKDEVVSKIHELCLLENHWDIEIHAIEAKYQKNFGEKTEWEEDIFGKIDKEKDEINNKRAAAASKIIVEIINELGNMIDEEKLVEHMKYYRVFFGNEDSETLLDKILE